MSIFAASLFIARAKHPTKQTNPQIYTNLNQKTRAGPPWRERRKRKKGTASTGLTGFRRREQEATKRTKGQVNFCDPLFLASFPSIETLVWTVGPLAASRPMSSGRKLLPHRRIVIMM